MKANELMIGDWVYAIDDNGEKYPCRVNNLEYDYINKHDDFCVDFYGTDYKPEWPDVTFNVEPIPITPEILEKNGFERDIVWHYCQRTYGEYIVNVQLGYANKIEFVEIRETGKDDVVPSEKTRLYLPHISYVHELQHILRLCGIKKEIEL